ncbi:methionine--tRNA ligase [Spartinivicinus poritis]|uniref:Methionine--tRNA ligase n=1 Tax=Spartinivicinus poritis TaxID=2994640 RepID=A0ABT5UE53_9GAMM|nr:methionine--tRNA ligase [Spartinivicinus sp. A2-2]MDE1464646.1 methionine--tRNA ligase [Spartinivicinus sp. A2-2]
MTDIITTPIFYANGNPHLGHAYSGYIADVAKRFHSLANKGDSLLITGTDEHGQKIADTARAHEVNVSQFVNDRAKAFQTLWPQLNIQPNIFVRTTECFHYKIIQAVWRTLFQNGDIYLGFYQGNYCIGCEQFYSSYELEDGCCPIHKAPTHNTSEETYLFKLESYRQQLIEHYQRYPNFITPNHYSHSILDYLQQGPLEDLSVSRVNNEWGINVPHNPKHTIYVWIDALFSYLTALQRAGFNQDDLQKTTHIIGKDILKFHAVYWPIFLLAANLPLPKRLVIHGWWTINGEKISKSNPETLVSPTDLTDQLTKDGLRYALLRQKPLARDGNIVIDELKDLINADLAHSFANLVKRNHTLVIKYFSGVIDSSIINQQTLSNTSQFIINHCGQILKKIFDQYKAYEFYQVTLLLKGLLDSCNHYFHKRTPWEINKGKDRNEVAETCLVTSNLIRQLAIAFYPLTPNLSTSILDELGDDVKSCQWQSRFQIQSIEINHARSHFSKLYPKKTL